MLKQAEIIYIGRVLIYNYVKKFVYFPFWWYTQGLVNTLRSAARSLTAANNRLSISILLRYWFKPMYGQYDTAGKLISFFMRTVQLLWHLLLMLIWLLLLVATTIFYLLLPLGIIYQIIF